jgi:hypothetical protein
MKRRSQLVRWTLALMLCGGVCLPVVAQKNRPPAPAPHANPPKSNPNRPPASQSRPAQQQRAERQAERQNGGQADRNLTPRQQLGVGAARPWVQRMRQATPAQRERFFQNSPAFRNLPPEKQNKIREQFNRWDRLTPQQKVDQETRERNWQSLTPEQKDHIRNDVLPAWRQMSPDRRQAVQHRLEILQNMPESARNQRLNDPKFTEGMSDEDKAMLHDLSHMHIGGAPDPPSE